MNNNELNILEEILKQRPHLPAGPLYKDVQKRLALLLDNEENELKKIYSLTESHAPTMRMKAAYRYDKKKQSLENIQKSMNKDHIDFKCPQFLDSEINDMISKVQEMPKEWTMVQFTTQFNLSESCQINLDKSYTDPIHLTIFSCGQKEMNPFSITINAPKDVLGQTFQLCKEMKSIIDENKNIFHNFIGKMPMNNITHKQRKLYAEHRAGINERLKSVVKQLEKNWLGESKCFLIGKIVDENVEQTIKQQIDSLVKKSSCKITEKTRYIIEKMIICSPYMCSTSIIKMLQQNISNKELHSDVKKLLTDLSSQFNFKLMKRHPVILIIDEKLDCFPWEMMDILVDHPVSRMPSLHFAYALFKEHEDTIVDGFKQVCSTQGTYVINPGLDLKNMEVRLKNFFKYWLPEWEGIAGVEPTSDQFCDLLNGGEIFVYNGHGSGTQFLSGSKIQQLRVGSVVFLFGCGSMRMNATKPLVEMTNVFSHYMIACSPCVTGMLWEVTDFDTDIFSTGLLSCWLPSKSTPHWSQIDKSSWQKGTIVTSKNASEMSKGEDFEPELLRAITIARKAPTQYITKCAFIARGLPVKLII